ncbi:FecR family protein [Algoriphagus ratkowskyi]|nr:FecR family protein [Algoriphagus ratkowskyi]PZX52137.1 FecR family protein [Algoriphagus ratkowskyi]
MIKEQFVNLLHKKAAGTASIGEMKQIEETFKRLEKSGQNLPWTLAEQAEIKQRIQSKLPIKGARQVVIDWKRYLIAVAASLLIFIATYGAYQEYSFVPQIPMIQRSTNSSQRAQVILPDGSLVHLNVNTTLTFPEVFDVGQRIVKLEGEAFFEVKKNPDKPFLVQTERLITTVLGTSFNINAATGAASIVSVNTGKVEVSVVHHAGDGLILHPDQQVELTDSGALEFSEVNSAGISSWKSNEMRFELLPFEEVISMLSRNYHVKITLRENSAKGCLIKASYTNNGVKSILEGLQHLANFDFLILENGDVIIDYKNCKN